ncbi:MAG: LamG-like jellyroll fold domain-containing protein [Bacteroidales bacterium]|nr:LamG-like jellyroll fold domain-containing protein [Bacteroidales bacterium]
MKKAKEFMDAGMYEQAIQLLEIEIQANPKNAEASFLLGKCFLQSTNTRKVEDCFNRAILLNTDFKNEIGSLYFDKSLEQFKSDDPASATSYYEQGLKYNPTGAEEFAEKLYNYANESSETTTYPEKPIKIFNAIIQISPNYKTKIAEKTYSLAKSFIAKGFVKEGFEYADYGINFDPIHIKDVSDLYFNYANTLLISLNKPNECIFYFDKCLKLNPNRKIEIGNIYFNQAKIYEKNNESTLLLLFASKCNEINPDYNSWYLKLSEKYKPKISTDGLLAYYSFNGSSEDNSGHSFNLVNNGGISSTDRFNQNKMAFYFNNNSYMENNRGVNVSSDFSISVWIKPDISNNYSQPVTVGYRNGDNIRITYNPRNSTVGFDAWLGGPTGVFSKTTVSKSEWTHIVGVRNGSSWKVYLNGHFDNSSYGSSNTLNNAIIKVADFIGVGHFNGSIDDIRIYNRALSELEITNIYTE